MDNRFWPDIERDPSFVPTSPIKCQYLPTIRPKKEGIIKRVIRFLLRKKKPNPLGRSIVAYIKPVKPMEFSRQDKIGEAE